MSQTGSTSFLRVSSVGSVPIFSDTFIDENSVTSNYSSVDPILFSATSNQVKAIILDITVPDRKDLVDSNGNKLPDDVIFSSADIRLRVAGAPGTNTQVRGYILTTAASIPDTDWSTQDGSTEWYPDQFGETDGDGNPLKVVHGEIIINENMNPSDDTYITLNMFNLRKKQADVDFGKNFQVIIYASVASGWGVHSADHTTNTDHCPHLKIHYIKPAPDAATITVTPDSFGHNGTVNIIKPTSDKNLQQYSLAYKTSSGVVQTDNTTDITDIGTKSILLTDLTQAAITGPPAYAKRYAFADRSTHFFKLFSEDLYNTNTNATPSNEVNPRIRPSATNKFHSYNAAGVQDDTPTIGEEMTLRLSPIDVYGKVSEYAINFDVESSLVDTGITWNATTAPHGGTTWTDDGTDAAYTKLFNSNPDAFTLGETLKITSDAGSEFVIVVGEDSSNGFTVVKRAQLNTAAVSHTGLSDTTKIFKVNYDDFYFVKLPSLSPSLSVKHTFSKASTDIHTNHVAIIIKDEYGWASFPASLNYRDGSIVAEANPIAKITTSRTKVPYAKYGDQTTGLTLSLSNSSAVGSNRELTHYGFTYNAFQDSTVATANAMSNNNECFETGTKRVQLISTGSDSLVDSTWRIFGLASVGSDGSDTPDNATGFSHYEYTSEQITVGARLTPVATNKYWKNIECVVCEEIDSDDDGNRFLLMVVPEDLTTHSASVLNEDDVGVDLISSETDVTVFDSSLYKAGDVVAIGTGPELMLITSIDSATSFTVKRNYLFTTNLEYSDGVNIFIVENKDIKQIFVNKELRAKAKYLDSNFASEYMWGGFARIKATDIDFSANNILGLDSVNSDSSFNDKDWYANGFAVGDVIKLQSNKTVNGTYAAPGYYKILDIQQTGGSGDYDLAYVAEHADMLSDEEATYVSTSFTEEDGRTADIVRYDNAANPTITVALYNYNAGSDSYLGSADTIKFKGFVMDDDTTDFITNRSEDTLSVRAVGLSTLDLDALASSGDIAILNYNIGRSGGASAIMPLGDRRYPIGGTHSSLGMLSMRISIRILTQAGYRAIYSLIEGDRYDFAFLDNKKVDTPTSPYKSYRMKLSDGEISKDTDMASQYLASLTMIIMGEEVS